MNLAVIGSGGREHAICYKLKQSSKIKKLICIPGNAGTKKIAENIHLFGHIQCSNVTSTPGKGDCFPFFNI